MPHRHLLFLSNLRVQLAWNKNQRINPLLEIPYPRQILGYKLPAGPSTGVFFLLQPLGMLFLKVGANLTGFNLTLMAEEE